MPVHSSSSCACIHSLAHASSCKRLADKVPVRMCTSCMMCVMCFYSDTNPPQIMVQIHASALSGTLASFASEQMSKPRLVNKNQVDPTLTLGHTDEYVDCRPEVHSLSDKGHTATLFVNGTTAVRAFSGPLSFRLPACQCPSPAMTHDPCASTCAPFGAVLAKLVRCVHAYVCLLTCTL